MDKKLIVVIVPIFSVQMDLWIPNNKKIGLLKEKVFELLGNNYGFTGYQLLRLIDRSTGVELDSDLLISQSSIINGSKIIFI